MAAPLASSVSNYFGERTQLVPQSAPPGDISTPSGLSLWMHSPMESFSRVSAVALVTTCLQYAQFEHIGLSGCASTFPQGITESSRFSQLGSFFAINRFTAGSLRRSSQNGWVRGGARS